MRRLAARALPCLTLAAAGLAPAASAADRIDRTQPPRQFNIVDKAGDTAAFRGAMDEFDIVSATVVQDRAEGVFRASVTFAGPSTGMPAQLHVALGIKRFDECQNDVTIPGVAHIFSPMNAPTAAYSISSSTPIGGAATKSVSGATVTVATASAPAIFSARGWDCAVVTTELVDPEDKFSSPQIVDEAFAFADPEVRNPGVVAPPPLNGTPVVLDADRDGVADAADQCPQVAGARVNGCPTASDARSLRLGAKRLVIDRLIPRTAARCPGAVRVKVTGSGRTLASKKVGVVQHGDFCHADVQVRFKKRASRARVVISGSGIKTVRVALRR